MNSGKNSAVFDCSRSSQVIEIIDIIADMAGLLQGKIEIFPLLAAEKCGSVDREMAGDEAVLENAAAAVGQMALHGEALEQAADRVRPGARSHRHVLREVVAKAAARDKEGFETARPGGGAERVGHRSDGRVDREIGPVGGETAAGSECIEAARPEH